jgi:carbon storage regulator
MLVLTRKPGEKIIVGNSYQIEVVAAERGVVTLALFVDQPLTLMPGNVRIDAGMNEPGQAPRAIRLSRKVDDSVLIGDDLERQIEILVVSVKGEAVRVGVKAPRDVQVHRQEVFELIETENIAAAQAPSVDTSQLQKLLARRRCPACGAEMAPRSKKCPQCGAVLTG